MATKPDKMPMSGLGPVSRVGDRARLEARSTAMSRSNSLIEQAKAKKAKTSSLKPAESFNRMPAPTPNVSPNRASATFTPGSKADMAYTRTMPKPVTPRPKPRVGGTGKLAIAGAAVSGAQMMYQKATSKRRK